MPGPAIYPGLGLRPEATPFELSRINRSVGQSEQLYGGPYAAIALQSEIPGTAAGGRGTLQFDQDSSQWFEIGQHLFDRANANGDMSALEMSSIELGQNQQMLLGGGDSIRFDAIAGTRSYAEGIYRPHIWSPPLFMPPGRRVMLSLQNNDPATMQIAGFMEGRLLVPASHDYVRAATQQPLVYGQPMMATRDLLIPIGETREFRIEATPHYGMQFHAFKIFSNNADSELDFGEIQIQSIRVHADQEALYGQVAGNASIPAQLWGGLTSDLATAAAAPRDVWHYLPWPITVFPDRRLQISLFNRGAAGANLQIRVVAAGQFLLPR